MTEQWRDVVGYEGLYQVSDLGHVRSLDRMSPLSDGSGMRSTKGRTLRPAVAGNGYLTVALHRGGQITRTVHSLVARAFLGPRPTGLDVCHVDGDRLNPVLSNLRYDTRASNILDAVQHGTHFQASKTRCHQGHEFTPENTYIRNGGRNCRTCHAIARARYLDRKRAS